MVLSTSSLSLAPVSDAAIFALRAVVRGEVILPGDEAFDAARRVQIFMPDRRPLVIVRAADAGDVAAAVDFARNGGLPLAVRSGGHSVSGHGTTDGGVVIDLSRMKGISIDPVTRTARVEAGATSGDLAGPAAAHGLALSTGDTASVGMGGLTTGGGIGYMVRQQGLTIDNLLAARVVTAAGEIVTASAAEHADLFWAIRGGGGNFGIATEFTYRLSPVAGVLGGALILPATPAIVRGYLEYAATAPDDLTTIGNVMHLPPLPFVAPERIGELVLLILVCWAGDIEEGQRALAPLRALAEPVADVVGPMPYPALYQLTAHQNQAHGVAVRAMFADDLSDATVETMLAAVAGSPSPFSTVQLRPLGGAMARVAPDTTAFAHRDARYFVAILDAWMDPTEDAAPHHAFADALYRQIRHEGSGTYVNFLQGESAEGLREAYPAATLARLAAIKRQYDPENLFRLNQNIEPARD